LKEDKIIDHLFRHQYGKLVSILTRIFGLENLELIEDAVQDTFIIAMKSWRQEIPANPQAWLTTAAKNRVFDIFKKLKSSQKRDQVFSSSTPAIAINEIFLDTEIEDAQLRMIFTACHPDLNPKDQISFALKTISGLSIKEIASALLAKEETIKKSLTRARKNIVERGVSFSIPIGIELTRRKSRVHEVIYLIFNEGFQSNRTDVLVRKELCNEAMRLCSFLLSHKFKDKSDTHALFALMCFHSARLDSKIGPNQEVVSLRKQDRLKWDSNLIVGGNNHMNKAVESCDVFSTYHYESAIAAEHLKARTFEETNWNKILLWYDKLCDLSPSDFMFLNKAIVLFQLNKLKASGVLLSKINIKNLGQRAYIYYNLMCDLNLELGENKGAKESLKKAIKLVSNSSERSFLMKKLNKLDIDLVI
jgi:RNA polymerase sigma-70 factor (ECF subfamily)